jgi:hypothetical protein
MYTIYMLCICNIVYISQLGHLKYESLGCQQFIKAFESSRNLVYKLQLCSFYKLGISYNTKLVDKYLFLPIRISSDTKLVVIFHIIRSVYQ